MLEKRYRICKNGHPPVRKECRAGMQCTRKAILMQKIVGSNGEMSMALEKLLDRDTRVIFCRIPREIDGEQ